MTNVQKTKDITTCPIFSKHSRKIFNGNFSEEERSEEQKLCDQICTNNRQTVCKFIIEEDIKFFKDHPEIINTTKNRKNLISV